VAAVPRIERTIARRSQLLRHTSTRKTGSCPHKLGQIARQNEPVVTSISASGRPLLTGTALQTEFLATHSKQTTEKILTGTRTHIRIFSFRPFTTQNLAQLIQRHRCLINLDRSDGPAFPRIANRNLTMRRASASRLPRAPLAKGASNAMRGICSAFFNRELDLLELHLNNRKQTTETTSNRELPTILNLAFHSPQNTGNSAVWSVLNAHQGSRAPVFFRGPELACRQASSNSHKNDGAQRLPFAANFPRALSLPSTSKSQDKHRPPASPRCGSRTRLR